MSMESSVFWGNTSHWGVTDAGVLLVVSMASGAGGHFFVLMHVSVKKKGRVVRGRCRVGAAPGRCRLLPGVLSAGRAVGL